SFGHRFRHATGHGAHLGGHFVGPLHAVAIAGLLLIGPLGAADVLHHGFADGPAGGVAALAVMRLANRTADRLAALPRLRFTQRVAGHVAAALLVLLVNRFANVLHAFLVASLGHLAADRAMTFL